MLMQKSVRDTFSVVLGVDTEALNNQKYTKWLQWQYTYTNNHTFTQFTHIIHIAFISLQSNLNDSINWEAISGIHFMASQTAQPGAHYGKGMCVLMSISCHPPHTHTHTLTQSFPPRPASLEQAGVDKRVSKQGHFLCPIRQWGAKV